MEGDAEFLRVRARGAQEVHGGLEIGAEFAGKVDGGGGFGQGEADEQARARIQGRGVWRREFVKDFCKFCRMIEHKVAHAGKNPGFPDGGAGFDRVHEVDFRAREQAADEADFADRGAVEMPHAAFPQGVQHRGFRVAFDGVQGLAVERADKGAGGGGDGGRADAVQRFFRAQLGDHRVHRLQARDGHRARGIRAERDAAVDLGHRGAVLDQAHGKIILARHAVLARLAARTKVKQNDPPPGRGAGILCVDARTSHRNKPFNQHRRLPIDPGPDGPTLDLPGCVSSLLCPQGLAARANASCSSIVDGAERSCTASHASGVMLIAHLAMRGTRN